MLLQKPLEISLYKWLWGCVEVIVGNQNEACVAIPHTIRQNTYGISVTNGTFCMMHADEILSYYRPFAFMLADLIFILSL